MSHFLRTWKEFDLKDVEKHLIVVGELSSDCFSCRKVGIDYHTAKCPNCATIFKYMGFRRKLRMSFLQKIKEELPQLILIDFDDFKKALGTKEARKLLDI